MPASMTKCVPACREADLLRAQRKSVYICSFADKFAPERWITWHNFYAIFSLYAHFSIYARI